MKKTILCSLFLSFFIPSVWAQIAIISANNSNRPGKIDIAKWNALDSSSVRFYPSDLNSYAVGSSAYSDYTGNYYLSGNSNTGSGRITFNTYTNTQSFSSGSFLSNITEFDMSTGIMYKLTMDTLKTVSVIAHDVNSNRDSTIGTFSEPMLTGLLFDAICFDANNGIIYHVGIHTDFSTHLYAMRCRDSNFTFTKTPITTSFYRTIFSGLNYDNVHNKIYARMAKFDTSNTYLGSDIVEISASNGSVSPKIAINQFPFFAAASSCFDQRTSTYMVIGAMNGSNRKMICYNTVSDSIAIGYVPNGVADLQCDNTAFAQLKYGTPTGIQKISRAEPIGVFPNPFSDKLNLIIPANLLEVAMKIELTNMLGELVYSNNIATTQTELTIQGLPKGIYFYKISSNNKLIQARKILAE
jgi:hypothetical protein